MTETRSDEDHVRDALRRLNPEFHTSDFSWEALDRLVARNQQLQEALELGARYAEGVMLREADPFLRDLHQENLDKIRAALASVRARSET